MKRIEEYERLLIVVDMVNGFVKEGNMHTPQMETIIPIIDEMIKDFKRNNDGVMFVKENHDKDCEEFNKFPAHCIKGTHEAEIIDEYQKYLDDSIVVDKNAKSVAFAPTFIPLIRQMENLKEVVVVGGCTDLCSMDCALPLINFFDQANKDTKVIFPTNANETFDSPTHNRLEYTKWACNFMNQSGIQIVKKYKKRGK